MNPKQKKAAYIVGYVIAAWLLYSYVKGRQANPADQLQPDQGMFGIPGAPIAGAYWTGGGDGGPTPVKGPAPDPGTDKWSLDAQGHWRPILPVRHPGGQNPPDPNPPIPITILPNSPIHAIAAHPNAGHDVMPHMQPAGSAGEPVVPYPNFVTVGGTAGGYRR